MSTLVAVIDATFAYLSLLARRAGPWLDGEYAETAVQSKLLYAGAVVVGIVLFLVIAKESPIAAFFLIVFFAVIVMMIGSGFDTEFGGRDTLRFYWR